MLGWAGIEIEDGGFSLLVDPVTTFGALERYVDPAAPAPIAPREGAGAALLTHLHRDHADAATLRAALAPGAPVLAPPRAEGPLLEIGGVAEAQGELDAAGLEQRAMEPGDTAELGPFTVTALPAVDGTGDPQVSWLVAAGDTRILHAGDTMWHGWWWTFALRHGPPAAAFLPANGAVLDLPHRQPPADVPAALTPEQAVEAARALSAGRLVPMHYGTFQHPRRYRARDDAEEAVARAAAERGVETTILRPGDAVSLAVE